MSQSIRSLVKWLLNPHPRITDPEKIQRSRLLSAILLAMIVLGLTILVLVVRHDPGDIYEPEVQGAIAVLLITIGMYIFNRMGHNRHAAAGVILPFVIVFTYVAFSSSGKAIFLAFLSVPILLTAIFFPLRLTSLIAGTILLTILILLAFQDQVSSTSPFWSLRNMWFLLLLETGFILTFMWHLENLEDLRQKELMRINNELEQKVAELERFTSTVSHELKSPIVTIKGFLGSFDRDLSDGRVEPARKDLLRVAKAADNMYTTMSDLLALSRVGRLVNPFEEFPLLELVQEAIESTGGILESHQVRVQVEPALPIVYGDRKRLREVLENLIDNAAKYKGNQQHPLVEIGMRKESEPVFFVRDNGMGIAPQYHAKVFGLFDKLDPNSEGTGIGLALIKRIIETHGGRIWVESEGHGSGSTFYFTIPDRRERHRSGGVPIR